MAKPTGFMEFKRELPTDAAPKERVTHWLEFHHNLTPEKLNQQSARCMDCGIPFCHTGINISGMASGCPINNLIPEWNDLVYKGMWEEAAKRLFKTNNFPEFTGRVCPAPCEGSCTLGLTADPVTIKNIEYTIIERAYAEGWVDTAPPSFRSGRKIAVVGSGPAGLTAADQLNKAGHLVTVYERADRIGGLLMYGIPNMKLDKSIVQRRLDIMAKQGITFVTNTEVGKDISTDQLLASYDAVVLCGGATKPRDLPIEGRQLQGIHYAMDFLHGNTKDLLDQANPVKATAVNKPFISAQGKDVVIIGGGDTGTDCVGTSLRHGSKSVTQLEILDKPPVERAANNPWPEWPKVYKLDYGQEEYKDIYGEDPRQFAITAKRFVGDENGQVKEVHTVGVEWTRDESGRFFPKEIAGTERVIPAQLVLLAMGFLGPDESILGSINVERDERSNVKTGAGKFTTSRPGVFAAGDMRRGQSLVVWAINEGRGAAKECDAYLKTLQE